MPGRSTKIDSNTCLVFNYYAPRYVFGARFCSFTWKSRYRQRFFLCLLRVMNEVLVMLMVMIMMMLLLMMKQVVMLNIQVMTKKDDTLQEEVMR